MRPVRTFVALLALFAAAGCRTGDITAPQAPPAARHDDAASGGMMGSDGITSTGASTGLNAPGDSTVTNPGGVDRG